MKREQRPRLALRSQIRSYDLGSEVDVNPVASDGDRALVQPGIVDWLGGRALPWVGSNAGASPIPFQAWHHFKEAFAPELVARAVSEVVGDGAVFDPFGGSGTTALACQFLGVDVTTLEVNPFLADVIRAKLTRHVADDLRAAFTQLVETARTGEPATMATGSPSTLVQPGHGGRFVFHEDAGGQVLQLAAAIGKLEDEGQQAFFRTALGGVLVGLSNVVINGKGRRYRRRWEERSDPGIEGVNRAFSERVELALVDIERFSDRLSCDWEVVNTDARDYEPKRPTDLVICSPPYPNSFDYTDVYNLELWMLGYLAPQGSNRKLRQATLSSHVQIQRDFVDAPQGSPQLVSALEQLDEVRTELWNPWIPDMVGAYFGELLDLLTCARASMSDGGQLWLVVGDSRYKGILVPVAAVLEELLTGLGWELLNSSDSRSMRSSAQQGGQKNLAETLLVLRNAS